MGGKRLAGVALIALVSMVLGGLAWPGTSTSELAGQVPTPGQAFVDLIPVEELSPAMLGIYRKVMEIEDEIASHAEKFKIDYDLARAVCMYESGGNANLTSWAGAKGYFQVLPATYRSLRVDSNIEGGVKYLGQLVDRFKREDYALAAYNGGPTNVGRGRAMRLESLQYVIGVGYYRTMLKMYERSIRFHASKLQLLEVGEGEDWWGLSKRLGIPLLQLRLHNPYVGHRELRAGYLVAYPLEPREDLLEVVRGGLHYRARHGDNYFTIAFAFEVDLDALREVNSLWHLQTLPTGMVVKIPLGWEGEFLEHRVAAGEELGEIAAGLESHPWRIIRDNGLFWDESVAEGMLLRVRKVPPRPKFLMHQVVRGETLTVIARRYNTTIPKIQEVNAMGRRTMIRIGEQLRIPQVAE